MPVQLSQLVEALDRIAPFHLAESWDNVGCLIEPARPRAVRKVMLTIDLTEATCEEAVKGGADAVIAYHPPLFEPIKRLNGRHPHQRLLLRLIEGRVALLSPHTALDAAEGGVNDWLIGGLGGGTVEPIAPAAVTEGQTHKVVVFAPAEAAERVRAAMAAAGAGRIGHYEQCSFNLSGYGTFRGDATTSPAVGRAGRLETVEEIRIEMVCGTSDLPRVAGAIRASHPYEEPAWEVYALAGRPSGSIGMGRLLRLDRPVSLKAMVGRVKKHLGLKHVRLASSSSYAGGQSVVRTVAACAGAGGSVLRGVSADVYLTGEMRHHDVLAANAAGASVILTDHTNTERGYLPTLRRRLSELLGTSVRIEVCRTDSDPLCVV